MAIKRKNDKVLDQAQKTSATITTFRSLQNTKTMGDSSQKHPENS
jgi:hypothetical protein